MCFEMRTTFFHSGRARFTIWTAGCPLELNFHLFFGGSSSITITTLQPLRPSSCLPIPSTSEFVSVHSPAATPGAPILVVRTEVTSNVLKECNLVQLDVLFPFLHAHRATPSTFCTKTCCDGALHRSHIKHSALTLM